MHSDKELKANFQDPKKERVYFQTFSKLVLELDPSLTQEQVRQKWIDLKTDAGLMDG